MPKKRRSDLDLTPKGRDLRERERCFSEGILECDILASNANFTPEGKENVCVSFTVLVTSSVSLIDIVNRDT